MVPDLDKPLHLHVIGAGGAAMSAIMHIALRMGHVVSGSDQSESSVLDRLRAHGCAAWAPHDVSRLPARVDLAVVSVAIKESNPELVALRDRNVAIASRADFMEALGRRKTTAAVSGTAGKTTTAAMLAVIAVAAGREPSMIVGATIEGLGDGVAWTGTDLFVVEADESDGSFLRFHADAVVVNNIEPDHLDFWRTVERLEAGFDEFVTQARGPKVVNIDDPGVRAMLDRLDPAITGLHTFGFAEDAEYRIEGFAARGLTTSFRITRDGRDLGSIELSVPGRHNASNATAAFVMALGLGIPSDQAVDGLARFRGAARRFEFRGEARGVTFVDDYAHLPMKARAAVEAALQGGWSRVVAVYQPHRFTRTADLWRDYANSFIGVDVLFITDIYAAGQLPIDGVTGALVADAVKSAHPDQSVHYVEGRDALMALLQAELREGDLCLTMNAGDLTTLPSDMLASAWASTGAGRD